MQTHELIGLYKAHPWVQTLAHQLQKSPPTCWHLKGLAGSLDAVLVASLHTITQHTQLCVLEDKEEAAYFYSDISNLLPAAAVFYYPGFAQTTALGDPRHAEGLASGAVLYQLSQEKPTPILVISYPEALSSPVVAKAQLAAHTFTIDQGQATDMAALIQRLLRAGFEQVDFVYTPGSLAVRGGIIDIFSYAHPWPYRLEWSDQIVESIRTFDPVHQASVDAVATAMIMPPMQEQSTAHLLDFFPTDTFLWCKDYADLREQGLLETPLDQRTRIAFGHRFDQQPDEVFTYQATAQTSFHQQLELLKDSLQANQAQGIRNILIATSPHQLERLTDRLGAIDASLSFDTLCLGLRQGFVDAQTGIAIYTDHQIVGRHYPYTLPRALTQAKGVGTATLQALQVGDYVVHMDYGVAKFGGLTRVAVNGKQQEVLRLIYKDNGLVYASVHALHKISKYVGKDGTAPAVSQLGTTAWEQKKKKIKRKVQDMAQSLIELYSQRRHAAGFAFGQDNSLQIELAASFMYEDTPDQAKAIADVKRDMEAPHPMDRLVCGDVGFGKTEVAIRAAFKAVNDNKQVAILVPTTVLALQHYQSFSRRLAQFPVSIAYINRFKDRASTQKIRTETAQGQVDILIGTHKILSQDVKFKDLGLLIIDEEHKFGVKAKERLKELKLTVDVLTLTATPIPRTLHFSLMGARDLSVINTPPPNRQAVTTHIHTFDKKLIQEAIQYELQRGGQVFFVHSRIANIEEMAQLLQELVPNCSIGVAHGQMPGQALEKKMLDFIEGAYDVLVSTSIIESGLDIPNANTIIINDSHGFGLADLHQMRGRVGRSNKKAFCYLMAPPTRTLSSEARKRLRVLEEFSGLGSGFQIAMRDLDIRGAGDLLGAEQSGFITDVGLEAYCKILDEAVGELKATQFKELFAEELAQKGRVPKTDCTLETDLPLSIPDTYVQSDQERIRLYTQLDSIQDTAGLATFRSELRDRFGALPTAVEELIKAIRLRWAAQRLGLRKLRIKEGAMRCYFTATVEDGGVVERVVGYVQRYPQRCSLQEVKGQLVLVVKEVGSVEVAQKVLEWVGVKEEG
ncbi:MAG: transcription-repair coupling factor [Bacteroidota bacterium]